MDILATQRDRFPMFAKLGISIYDFLTINQLSLEVPDIYNVVFTQYNMI